MIERRQLGNTDLQVSTLSFGAATFGDAYGMVTQDEANHAVASAIEHGINLFDTSPYYGNGQSEEMLGKALHGQRDKVILATKAGQAGTGKDRIHDMSSAYIRQLFDESLQRLNTDYVDLCQLHDIDNDDPEQLIQESLPTLLDLKQQGKIRYIGITAYNIDILVRVARAFPVDCMLTYCRYSLLDTTLTDRLLPFTQSEGIGLINASPLHMGVLVDIDPPSWHPVSDEIRSRVKQARKLCREHKMTIAELALQFAYANQQVASTLVGIKTAQEVEQNIMIINQPINQQLLDDVQDLFRPIINQPLM